MQHRSIWKKLTANLNDAINQNSRQVRKRVSLPRPELPYLALNPPVFERAGINEQEARQAVQMPCRVPSTRSQTNRYDNNLQKFACRAPCALRQLTRQQLAQGMVPPTQFGEILGHSYSKKAAVCDGHRAGPINGAPERHPDHAFSPYSYDRPRAAGFSWSIFSRRPSSRRVGGGRRLISRRPLHRC